ncbi:S8 family serine peptidase [Corynebacterium kozikiae]|uniref:S8 family serine peptidase n=1 Tax=Corynebacterium kozikiae TaxID=2968469 RepID=UPI00211C03F1|nr:S8 family serine peptidase [Corynebacterium sp. 76QC2CO]
MARVRGAAAVAGRVLCAAMVAVGVGVGVGWPVEAWAQERRCAQPVEANEHAIAQQLDIADEYAAAHRFATGAGVRVAVIDTGVAAHPDLGEVIDGGNFVPTASQGAFDDCDAHGTIVAGVIAARGGVAGGPRGVAPDAQIIAIKHTSAVAEQDPQGNLGSLAQAIQSALAHDAHVINISVVSCVPAGIAVDLSPLEEALAQAEARGTVVIAAAGNTSPSCQDGNQVFPAHLPTVVGVRALANPYQIADYALSSPHPTLAARGEVPAALHPHGQSHAMGLAQQDAIVPFVGTSFAAPVVSGTAALLKQRHPHASAAEIRQALFDSVDPATGAVDPTRSITTPLMDKCATCVHEGEVVEAVGPAAPLPSLGLWAVAMALVVMAITAAAKQFQRH